MKSLGQWLELQHALKIGFGNDEIKPVILHAKKLHLTFEHQLQPIFQFSLEDRFFFHRHTESGSEQS